MSSTVLVPNLLVANRKGIEELSEDGPRILPFDSSVHKKRKTSSIVYDTRSFKRRKFSRSYIEKNLQNKRGSSRFSRRRHHGDLLQDVNLPNGDSNISSDQENVRDDTKARKLRTHVWNVKRMHMEDVCGYMVPVRSHRHGFKAATRLFNNEKKTFIHDFSYHNIVQLNFENLDITVNIMSQIMDPNCNFFQTLVNGNILSQNIPLIEHNVLIYEKNLFPMGLIGVCKVMTTVMRDLSSSDPVSLQMWITCYPGITSAIINLFDEINGVIVQEIQSVDRLTLFGTQAHTILQGLCSISNANSAETVTDSSTSVASQISKFLSAAVCDSHVKLCNVWRTGYVLPVLVPDPRLAANVTNKDKYDDKHTTLRWPKMSTFVSSFPLWKNAVKATEFVSSPLSDYEVNHGKHLKSQAELTTLFNILEGTLTNSNDKNSNNCEESKIPLFIIHHRTQDKRNDNHYLSDRVLPGFSIILPRNWTKIFWQMCILRGAIPIGLEEIAYLQRSMDVLTFPNDYLDSDCGWQHYQERIERVCIQEEKKPAAKRLSWPHQSESTILSLYLNHENVEEADFVGSNCAVVRRKEYLQHFFINSDINAISTEEHNHSDWELEQFDMGNSNHSIPSLPEMPQVTYVHLKITPTCRGQVHPFALIFQPSAKDLKEFILRQLERKKKFRCENDMIMRNTSEGKYLPYINEWRGVQINVEDSNSEDDNIKNEIENNRVLLGSVTSGDDANGSNDHMGLAFCRVDLVYDLMRCHFERFGHPLSHRLILFQNPGSGWLRPALMEYL